MQNDRQAQWLSDRAAVIEVTSRFQQGVDAKNSELILSCFAPDVVLDLDGFVVDGFEMATKYFHGEIVGGEVGITIEASTHLMSNVVPVFDGDRATTDPVAISHLAGTKDDTGERSVWVRGIRYQDEFARLGDEWKMCSRQKRLEWMFEAPPTMLVPPIPTSELPPRVAGSNRPTLAAADVPALADKAEIRDVLARMALGNDYYDCEAMMDCLTEDVQLQFTDTVTGELMVLPGKPAVRDVYRDLRLAKTLPLDFVDVATHYLTNIDVQLDGDTAHTDTGAVAYVVGPRDEGAVVLVRGISYDDDFERGPDGWRISRRKHTLEWMYEAVPTYVTPNPAIVGA